MAQIGASKSLRQRVWSWLLVTRSEARGHTASSWSRTGGGSSSSGSTTRGRHRASTQRGPEKREPVQPGQRPEDWCRFSKSTPHLRSVENAPPAVRRARSAATSQNHGSTYSWKVCSARGQSQGLRRSRTGSTFGVTQADHPGTERSSRTDVAAMRIPDVLNLLITRTCRTVGVSLHKVGHPGAAAPL